MRKRRSIDKTPGRSHDATACPQSPVGRLWRTPRRPSSSSCNNSFSDQSLEIIWDNNSPSPARTLALGKRKKNYGSDSSSSGGEISDLVQKLAKSGHTPDANPPLLQLWMSRECNTAVQRNNPADKNDACKQKAKEFQTPSRRPRRVLRKCNKSKMKLLKQDIELLCHPMAKTESKESSAEKKEPRTTEQQQQSSEKAGDVFTSIKLQGTPENSNKLSTTGSTTCNFFDGWDTDEDDMILSQVEIPCFKTNIQETQIMTNTQSLDSGKDTRQNSSPQELLLSNDPRTTRDRDTNDSIVTESWDFVDDLGESDDENILQSALEDFEKSQQVTVPTVQRLSQLHVKPNFSNKETNECGDLLPKDNPLGQARSIVSTSKFNTSTFQKNSVTDEKYSRKANYSFVPRSSLQNTVTARSETLTTQKVKQRELKNTNGLISCNTGLQRMENQRQIFQNGSERNCAKGSVKKQQDNAAKRATQNRTFSSKPARYSKEEIERKKLEAQNRRRQKMAQSQKKNQN